MSPFSLPTISDVGTHVGGGPGVPSFSGVRFGLHPEPDGQEPFIRAANLYIGLI
jgi:hypothetical protein